MPPPFRVREATERDFGAILHLNSEWVHHTSHLDEAALARLHRDSAYHRVVEADGEVVAFLLALREGVDYGSPNYQWFERRGGVFLYIDRVIVDSSYQRGGIARQLYDDLLAFARQTGIRRIVCELDIDPPNEASRRFHDAYGFRELGTQSVAGGRKRVSLRELDIGRDGVES